MIRPLLLSLYAVGNPWCEVFVQYFCWSMVYYGKEFSLPKAKILTVGPLHATEVTCTQRVGAMVAAHLLRS